MSNQPFPSVSSGETLKKIRKNKNYTQKFVTEGIISQSTYSKIEAGMVEPSYTKFIQLLKRLDMTEEEFRLLQNNEMDEREEIIHDFFLLNYNDQAALEVIKERIQAYTQLSDDVLVKDLGHICDAMLLIMKDRDYKKASKYALKVWKRLEKFDQWYLMEFRLINSILFVFPLESVIQIGERINDQLKAYNTRESRTLMNNMQINLSLVLIRNQEYELALHHLDELATRFQEERNYYFLAIAYLRKGVALTKLDRPEAEQFLAKAKKIIAVFEEPDLESALLNEIDFYTKETEK